MLDKILVKVGTVRKLNMLDKLGSLQKFARFIPGIGNVNVTPEMIEKSKAEATKYKAIIDVMTEHERANPHLLTSFRKQEIAMQSGTSVQIVNQMLEKFEQSKQFVKMFKKGGFPRQ